MFKQRDQIEDKQTYSMPEVAKLLGISIKTAYEGAGKGDYPAFKIMGRWIVPKPAIDKLLTGEIMKPKKKIKRLNF